MTLGNDDTTFVIENVRCFGTVSLAVLRKKNSKLSGNLQDGRIQH